MSLLMNFVNNEPILMLPMKSLALVQHSDIWLSFQFQFFFPLPNQFLWIGGRSEERSSARWIHSPNFRRHHRKRSSRGGNHFWALRPYAESGQARLTLRAMRCIETSSSSHGQELVEGAGSNLPLTRSYQVTSKLPNSSCNVERS